MKDVSKRIAALSEEQRIALLQHLRQRTTQVETHTEMCVPSADPWVLRYRPNDQARLRLFCFPYAGGRASIFRPWLDNLPEEVELCSIQLPGREERLGDPPYKRLVPLVRDLSEALAPYLDRPFAFYGHSMGALVSFEVARLLRRSYNRHPIAMHLAAFRAPQLPNPNIRIYHLPTEVFKVVLRADGISETILQSEELMQLMLPTLRADYEVCDTYEYHEEPPLACPFYLYGGLEDVRVREADLAGWPMHTSGPWHLSLLPGSHLFLHGAQDQLLAEICSSLEMDGKVSLSV